MAGYSLPVTAASPVTINSKTATGVAAVVAPSLSVTLPDKTIGAGGASFAVTGATAGYDSAAIGSNGGFFVDASATVIYGALGSVTASLGAAAKNIDGIVFDASGVNSVVAAVTNTVPIKVGGLSLTPSSLAIAYKRDDSFKLTGGATLSQQGGFRIGLALTGDGLVINATRTVTKVTATVNAVVGIAGAIAIEAKDLSLSYDKTGLNNAEPTFKVWGGVNVTVGSAHFQSVQATLGDKDTPGLTIVAGSLKTLNVGLSGTFDLFRVTVSPDDLHLKYDATKADDPTLTLFGGLKAQFTSSISKDTPLVIHTKTGAVDFSKGFGVHVSGDFKGFSLDAMVTYKTIVGGGYDVVTRGSLTTPAKIGFDAFLHLNNNKLVDIGIGVSAKIPVADTGLYNTWVYGSLNNLDTDDPTITAAATLIYGDAHILNVTGAIEVNKEHLLPSADKTNVPAIFTSGQVNRADHQLGVFLLDGAVGQFGGSIDLNWATGVYRLPAYGKLLDGLATVDVGMTLTNSGNLSFSADVGIGIPNSISVIGGLRLASGHVRLEYKNGDPNDSYVAGWGDFFGGLVRAGVEYNFGTTNLTFLDASAVSKLSSSATAKPRSTTGDPLSTFSATVSGTTTGSLQFIVSDPYFDVNYVNPNNSASRSSQGVLLYTLVQVRGPGDGSGGSGEGPLVGLWDTHYDIDPRTGKPLAPT